MSLDNLTPEDFDAGSALRPRHATSKSWTPLPDDFAAKIKTVFAQQFKSEAAVGDFLLEGRIYPDEILLRMGYLERGRLRQINFEASMDVPLVQDTIEEESAEGDEESLTITRLYTSIDALGSLLEEYFQKGNLEEMDVPRTWRPYEFEGETVYLQYSTVNSALEAEADRLLGLLQDDSLVR